MISKTSPDAFLFSKSSRHTYLGYVCEIVILLESKWLSLPDNNDNQNILDFVFSQLYLTSHSLLRQKNASQPLIFPIIIYGADEQKLCA